MRKKEKSVYFQIRKPTVAGGGPMKSNKCKQRKKRFRKDELLRELKHY